MNPTLPSKIVPALVLAALVLLPIPAYATWQYGVAMTPTTTYYQSYELAGTSLNSWSTVTKPDGITFWSSASNTGSGGGFAQNGFDVNNGSTNACFGTSPSGQTQVCLNSGEWGLFFEYCFVCSGSSQVYYGNSEWSTPPSYVSPTDEWYISGLTVASKGEYSWLWNDASAGYAWTNYVCNQQVNGAFTGVVLGVSESQNSSGYGSVNVSHVALWAQTTANDTRNSGSTSVWDVSSPHTVNMSVISNNDVTIGFLSSGSRPSGTQWTSTYHATLEDVPFDSC